MCDKGDKIPNISYIHYAPIQTKYFKVIASVISTRNDVANANAKF